MLAVPDTQNSNCKHTIQNKFLCFSVPGLQTGTINKCWCFYYVFTDVLTTVPDSTVSNDMMNDNKELGGKKRSNLKQISFWHLPGQETSTDRGQKSRCSDLIGTGNLKSILNYSHLN